MILEGLQSITGREGNFGKEGKNATKHLREKNSENIQEEKKNRTNEK